MKVGDVPEDERRRIWCEVNGFYYGVPDDLEAEIKCILVPGFQLTTGGSCGWEAYYTCGVHGEILRRKSGRWHHWVEWHVRETGYVAPDEDSGYENWRRVSEKEFIYLLGAAAREGR